MTVEMLGVLMVVGMLFGFTALGLHSVSGQPPTLGSQVSQQLFIWKEQISNRLFRTAQPDPVRQRYVANRLAYYSQSYSVAARNHLDQVLAPARSGDSGSR